MMHAVSHLHTCTTHVAPAGTHQAQNPSAPAGGLAAAGALGFGAAAPVPQPINLAASSSHAGGNTNTNGNVPSRKRLPFDFELYARKRAAS